MPTPRPDDPRDPMAEKAIAEVKKRYSSPPPETVEGEDYRESEGDRAARENQMLMRANDAAARSNTVLGLGNAFMENLSGLVPACTELEICKVRLREAIMWAMSGLQQHPELELPVVNDE